MKIPKRIKESIINCAEYYKRASMCEKMYENKLTDETSEKFENNMDDVFIDNCILVCNPGKRIRSKGE